MSECLGTALQARSVARERGASLATCLAAIAALGFAATPAHAGPIASPHSLPNDLSGVAVAAIVLGVLLLASAGRWRRSAAMLSLAGLMALFGFESSVHSVHHVLDPQSADTCAVFAGSQHALDGAPATPDVAGPVWMVRPAPAIDGDLAPRHGDCRLHESRAPPPSSASRLP